MTALPSRHRIRNFGEEMESPWLFRSEGLALHGLFSDPLLYTLGAEQAQLPEIGHLGTLRGSQVAGIGWVGAQSLEMRIGASLQNLFQCYQWHKKLIARDNLQQGDLPVFSPIAADIDSRRKGMVDDHLDQLRWEDDERRPVEADMLAKELYKTLLLEVGTLHVLLHEGGAKDAVSEIRLRHAQKHIHDLQTPFLRKLFVQEPVSDRELNDLQNRVDTIYANLQQALCASIPDRALYDAMERPFDSPLVKSSLEQIRQLYFHMYSANGQEQGFADRFLNFKGDAGPKR